MEIKDILIENNRRKAYCELSDFYKDMSYITDMNQFFQIMEMKKSEEKSKIEDGIITLANQKVLLDYEQTFLDNYHEYLSLKLNADVREYLNNNYCSHLYSDAWKKANHENNVNIKFINGKTIEEINEIIAIKHDELIERIRTGKDIDDNDKKFLEENFLSIVFEYVVYKEYDGEKDIMYDIVDYFQYNPITELNTPKKMQLNLLYILSKKMLEIPSNCAISFNYDYIKSGNTINAGGFSKIVEDETPCIQINGLGDNELYNKHAFLKKVFTIFHELGHFIQQAEFEQYVNEIKNIFTIEDYLISNDREFYHQFHDSFLKERDADNYASNELANEYGKKYPEIVSLIISKNANKKRIDTPTFTAMEEERYNNIKQQIEQSKSR